MSAPEPQDVAQQRGMLQALVAGLERSRAEGPASWIETHISHVILHGEFAYKIKKPLDLGFLDFSTLERRRFYCGEELRLNRRLAPGLYRDRVAITGSPQRPRLQGPGAAIEYAVRMRRFDQEALLSVHPPDRATIAEIAQRVAGFHREIEVAGPNSPHGTPQRVVEPMLENFVQIRATGVVETAQARLQRLEEWTRAQAGQLAPLLECRHREGHIRECHGDMHLGNITRYRGRLEIFDGIEFNPELRWIDTLNEIAFLVMDLQQRGLEGLAWGLLNDYLELTGDYEGVALLRFYQLYRAMVRAKVTAIRLAQADLPEDEGSALSEQFNGYLTLAERYTRAVAPVLLITHGLSGSGKSLYSGWLAERLPAIRLRSDVERQRLFSPAEGPGGAIGEGIYTPQATQATYGRLRTLAGGLLRAGYSVICDATFLKEGQRRWFRELADELGLPCIILDLQAPVPLLRERVSTRLRQGGDASEAGLEVLEMQLASRQSLGPAERAQALTIESRESPGEKLLDRLRQRLAG